MPGPPRQEEQFDSIVHRPAVTVGVDRLELFQIGFIAFHCHIETVAAVSHFEFRRAFFGIRGILLQYDESASFGKFLPGMVVQPAVYFRYAGDLVDGIFLCIQPAEGQQAG